MSAVEPRADAARESGGSAAAVPDGEGGSAASAMAIDPTGESDVSAVAAPEGENVVPSAALDVEADLAAAAPEPGAPAASEPETTPAPVELAGEAVRAWADAWAGQDVAAYLAAYSAAFEPTDGLSREAWEAWRRERLAAPAWIRLEIERLEITPGQPGRAEARFLQRYESSVYSDVVRKALVLADEGTGWRILAELAERP